MFFSQWFFFSHLRINIVVSISTCFFHFGFIHSFRLLFDFSVLYFFFLCDDFSKRVYNSNVYTQTHIDTKCHFYTLFTVVIVICLSLVALLVPSLSYQLKLFVICTPTPSSWLNVFRRQRIDRLYTAFESTVCSCVHHTRLQTVRLCNCIEIATQCWILSGLIRRSLWIDSDWLYFC